MSLESKRNIYFFLGKVILIALLIVFVIRCFLIESFTVNSSQMESSLLKGDEVLVNKTAYGIRMPVTVLSIPFTFDKIFGRKSYSSLIQIPYTRIFSSRVGGNDVVLFNNPGELEKPLDKRSLLISRCIGLPGDTVSVSGSDYSINGSIYTSAPDQIQPYCFGASYTDSISSILERLDIPSKEMKKLNDSVLVLSVSRFDAYRINQNLNGEDSLQVMADSLSYDFVIPFKGMNVKRTPGNIAFYVQAIMTETKGLVEVRDEKLLVDKLEQKSYVFTDDYYWMLGDNTLNSMDSRDIGFIPHKCIIGKAGVVWYSRDGNVRWERCFSPVN